MAIIDSTITFNCTNNGCDEQLEATYEFLDSGRKPEPMTRDYPGDPGEYPTWHIIFDVTCPECKHLYTAEELNEHEGVDSSMKDRLKEMDRYFAELRAEAKAERGGDWR